MQDGTDMPLCTGRFFESMSGEHPRQHGSKTIENLERVRTGLQHTTLALGSKCGFSLESSGEEIWRMAMLGACVWLPRLVVWAMSWSEHSFFS